MTDTVRADEILKEKETGKQEEKEKEEQKVGRSLCGLVA